MARTLTQNRETSRALAAVKMDVIREKGLKWWNGLLDEMSSVTKVSDLSDEHREVVERYV